MQLGTPCSFSPAEKQGLRQLSLEQVRQWQPDQPLVIRFTTLLDVGEKVHFLGYDTVQIQLKTLQRPRFAVRVQKVTMNNAPIWVSFTEGTASRQSADLDGTFSCSKYHTQYVMRLFSTNGQGKSLAEVERRAAILALWQDANWEYDHGLSIEVDEEWQEFAEQVVNEDPNAIGQSEPSAFQPQTGTWMVYELDEAQQRTGRQVGPFQQEDAEEIARVLEEMPEEEGWQYVAIDYTVVESREEEA